MKTSTRLICAFSLSILYIVTVGSLFIQHGDVTAHKAAGLLMIAGSVIHLANHKKWLKTVFSQPLNQLNRGLRRRRRSILWLAILTGVCAISAMLTQVLSEAPGYITRLHAFSGFLLIILTGIHIIRHRKWFSGSIQAVMPSKREEALPVITYENPTES